ncbi:MAG: PepSY domain-containing protein [Halovenus sp.]
MDRKVIIGAVGLVLLVGGVAFAASGAGAADPDLSEDEATGIATERVDGTVQEVELEDEGGPVYEVLVEQDDGTLMEVEIDGDNGDVLEVENEDDEAEDDEYEEGDDDE